MKKKHRQGKLPFHRAAKAKKRCACNGRCCNAAGDRCSCKYHGRGHGQKVVYRQTAAPRIKASVLGQCVSITYRRNGQLYRHQVDGHARILAPVTGSYIAIEGLAARHFLEG